MRFVRHVGRCAYLVLALAEALGLLESGEGGGKGRRKA